VEQAQSLAVEHFESNSLDGQHTKDVSSRLHNWLKARSAEILQQNLQECDQFASKLL
jgi:hypothetical protein